MLAAMAGWTERGQSGALGIRKADRDLDHSADIVRSVDHRSGAHGLVDMGSWFERDGAVYDDDVGIKPVQLRRSTLGTMSPPPSTRWSGNLVSSVDRA
ncbi:MAG: hypothetical protein M3462_06265 [Chloroflexota bacterium]|nr:hypothetical protein [Chloroflexota bacterium]